MFPYPNPNLRIEQVTDDKFLVLPNDKSSFAIPNALLPPQLHNDGNYIISLSQLTRWMATQAEAMGVEIYPGFAVSEVLYEDVPSTDGSDKVSKRVKGVATRDVGIGKDGEKKDTFTRGGFNRL